MIKLTQIDETNFLECFALRLGNGQERFVSSPIRSLAQAYVYRDQCMPFGIYAGDKMIGYVMVIYDCEYSCRMRNPERQGLKDLKRLEMA